MAKQSLLLVDGDVRSLRVLEVSLKKAGYNVTTAVNGRDGLDKVQTSHPDLIISDTEMSEMDGFEFCSILKGNPEWEVIPFIFLTGQTAIEHKIRGLELGVADYLTKPIYIKEITTRINLLLQKQERARIEGVRDSRTKFEGLLSDMGVVDLIQTIEVSRKSGVIHFIGETGQRAAIYFRAGKVIDAEAGRLVAEDAVYRLLTWSDGEFEAQFRNVRRKDVIEMSSQGLLMEGMRRLDEWGRHLEQLPSLSNIFEVDAGELSERLPELPDGLNAILKLFDARRSLLQIIDDSDFGDLECLEVISKLYFEGLIVEVDEPEESETDHLSEGWLAGTPREQLQLGADEEAAANADAVEEQIGLGDDLALGEEQTVTAEDLEVAGVDVVPQPQLVEQAIGAAVPVIPDGAGTGRTTLPGVGRPAGKRGNQKRAASVPPVDFEVAKPSSRKAEGPPPGVVKPPVLPSQRRHASEVNLAGDDELFPSDPTPLPRPVPDEDETTDPGFPPQGTQLISSRGADVASATGTVDSGVFPMPQPPEREIVTIKPQGVGDDENDEINQDGYIVKDGNELDPRFGGPEDTAAEDADNDEPENQPEPERKQAFSSAEDIEDLDDRPPAKTTWLAVFAGTVAVVGIIVFLLTRGSKEGDETAGNQPPDARVLIDLPLDAAVAMAPIADASVAALPIPDAPPIVRAPPDARARIVRTSKPDAGVDKRSQWKALMSAAKKAQRRGRYGEALKIVNEAIALRKSARAYQLKADILLDAGKPRDALAAANTAVRKSRRSSSAWKTKGMIHFELKQYPEAKQALGVYLKLKPRARDADIIRTIIDGL